MNVNYDSIHHYREHQYVKDFMTDESKIALVKNSGVYVSIGFDGHRLEDYDGFRVYEMYDFLKENGIKTVIYTDFSDSNIIDTVEKPGHARNQRQPRKTAKVQRSIERR